jgi:transposase
VNADTFRKKYKEKISDFGSWDQLDHCERYMLFEDNIGSYLSIDEVAVSKGELYTLVTNKAAKGKKGTIVACIEGTKADEIVKVLERIPVSKRKLVKEITLDMANNMGLAARKSFPMAKLVTDRFHVVRLSQNATQAQRIKLGWQELDYENEAISLAKKENKKYQTPKLSNGETKRELLARSRYILAKKESQWTDNQKQRADILFKSFPSLEIAHKHALSLRKCYECADKIDATIRFKNWIDKTKSLEIKEFNIVANTIENHFGTILNYYDNYNTNAAAESFNSKIKLFRANQRGVVDTKFFLFRLYKLFA